MLYFPRKVVEIRQAKEESQEDEVDNMSTTYAEADYENSVIELFRNDLGYEYIYGPDIERDFYSPLYVEVLLD